MASPKSTVVTVKSGDTLTSIAKQNGTTVKNILAANPKFTNDPKFKNGNMIWSGTKVVIPTKPTVTPKATTPPATTVVPPIVPVVPPATTIIVDNPILTADPATSSPASPPPPPPVKSAPIDTVLFNDEKVSDEFLIDVLFEDVAGQELLSIARNDTVNGQEVIYQPIKNLNLLQDTYNPTNLLNLYDTSETFFSNFIIDIKGKIPNVGNGDNGKNFYLDNATGDLIIEFINIAADEQVEVQITTNGTIEELGI